MTDTLKWIPLKDIKPSPTNPRKWFDQARLAELAGSIKTAGIVQPLVVRPKAGGYELVAGERRLRAAGLAGLPTAPAIVRELTDEQVLELQIIENNQRADVTALEEARGYRALMKLDPKKHTAGTIAGRIGKSEKYVWDRMKLLDLIEPAQELLDQGRITAGHAILIARLKPEQQKQVLDPDAGALFQHESADDGPSLALGEAPPENRKALVHRLAGGENPWEGLKARSLRELDTWIARNIRFDPAQAAAAAPLLFGATKAAVDAAAARPGRQKKVVAITHEFRCPDAIRRDGGEKIIGERMWKRADGKAGSKTCEHAVLGVVAAGADYGVAFDVCTAKDKCEVHWREEVRARKKTRAARASGVDPAASKARAAELARQQRADAEMRQREEKNEAWKRALPAILRSVADAVKRAPIAKLVARVLGESGDRVREARGLLGCGGAMKADDLVRALVLATLIREAWSWEAHRHFRKEAGDLGGGIAAALKAVHAPAAKAAPKAKKAAKAPARRRAA